MWTGVLAFDHLILGGSHAATVDDPVITSFAPAFGEAGTVVTLTGSQFTGATVVALGSIACTFAVVSDTTITATVPAGAVDAPWYVITPSGVGSSATVYDVTNVVGASSVTLRWALDVFPAVQPVGKRRVLLRDSRNALVVRDVVDAESDTYQTPDAIAWAVLEGADTAASGAFTAGAGEWRAEVALDPDTTLSASAMLSVTATLGPAEWTRWYPLTITTE